MTSEAPAQVHIVDDDELVRATMSYLLSNHGYSTEIYSGGPELFSDCSLKRGCILLDIRMPEMSGHEVLEELARRANTLPVVVMSACSDLPAVVRAMKLRAVDFIVKPASEEVLLGAISRAFVSGVKRNVAVAVAARLNRLSPRKRQVLQGLLDGLSNKEIARALAISSRTVEAHRTRMTNELGIAGLAETVRFAMDAGLTSNSEVGWHQRTTTNGWIGA
jgi:two-component system response regulator FixJ